MSDKVAKKFQELKKKYSGKKTALKFSIVRLEICVKQKTINFFRKRYFLLDFLK
ncbi:MAG: hypothetical protein UZ01_00487 [Candidatus Brocadia sinica]|uniref:5-formyltetrahydrofolate cyclo-ligase n=1 Tax=Candidatus Brocadia sinica JPN1 TaxID=1197129 RepID=A0ABQ0JWM7_9BACT|nr:MAG: hypothetical protein UZ01_00487 [Candidatus Brocadia sinica]GAN33184.1 5-formyltetrahydrofolate cyclo-ligase [Candidatus Brocadia sinica JPN1]GIK13029.1 MAG: hypothetical protein BroJett002_17360 [Candidatus Brocadia sinica]